MRFRLLSAPFLAVICVAKPIVSPHTSAETFTLQKSHFHRDYEGHEFTLGAPCDDGRSLRVYTRASSESPPPRIPTSMYFRTQDSFERQGSSDLSRQTSSATLASLKDSDRQHWPQDSEAHLGGKLSASKENSGQIHRQESIQSVHSSQKVQKSEQQRNSVHTVHSINSLQEHSISKSHPKKTSLAKRPKQSFQKILDFCKRKTRQKEDDPGPMNTFRDHTDSEIGVAPVTCLSILFGEKKKWGQIEHEKTLEDAKHSAGTSRWNLPIEGSGLLF